MHRTPGQAPEQEGINGTGGDFTLLELARYAVGVVQQPTELTG